jgi:hypothetical protein
MAENKQESVETGSSIATNVPNPNAFDSVELGETKNKGSQPPEDNSKQLEELESLVGRQGQELGEFRKFFSDIAPLLDKLDKSPEIVQAIIDGEITADLAKAVIEGRVSVSDAEIVSKAHEEVKKDLGKEGYKGASPEEISKLVEAEAKKIKTEFQTELKTELKKRDDLSAFEAEVTDFISRTPDFKEYASKIDEWLDKHEDVTDIAVAYYAVKGELSEKEAQKQADIDKAEAEKNAALNMGGGPGNVTHLRGDENVVDTLIASKTNPNSF